MTSEILNDIPYGMLIGVIVLLPPLVLALNANGPRRHYALLLPLLVLAGAACRPAGQEGVSFPHATHIALGTTCADCHVKGGQIPDTNTCSTCHAEAMERVTPKDVERIIGTRLPYSGAYGLIFDHEKHSGLDCASCHSAADSGMSRPTMQSCLDACHGEKAAVPLSCASCHATLDKAGRPISHATGWSRRHGITARSSKEDCSSCHTEDKCFSCHRVTKPVNHNQHFRLRGHGVIAQADREKCLSCHQENYCSTCHLATKPISHTSAWTGRFQRHCTNCHLPLQNNNCATCHTSAQHKTAPSWPVNATHVTGADCRTCHRGVGAGLNHSDNGDNCETCHAK